MKVNRRNASVPTNLVKGIVQAAMKKVNRSNDIIKETVQKDNAKNLLHRLAGNNVIDHATKSCNRGSNNFIK